MPRNIIKGDGGTGKLIGKPFLPSNLNELSLWLRADDGVTYDGSNNVNNWSDQSGNGNDATGDIGGGTAPTYQTNTINGLPVIRFDGSGQLMTLTSSVGGSEYTFFIVCKNNDNADGSMFLWSTDDNYAKYVGVVTATSYNINGRNKFILSQDDEGSGNSGVLAFSDGEANNDFIIGAAIKYQGNPLGEGKAYLNGAGGNNGVNANMFNGEQFFNLIGGYGFGYELDGDVAEIICYNRALSEKEYRKVQTYLSKKYRIY